MLEQLSDRVRECLDHAADAKAKADATNEPASKAEFLKMQEHWLVLARSSGFTESLCDFTTANSEQARQFDEHLQATSLSSRFAPPGSIGESSDDWLDDALQLREISTSLIAQDNLRLPV